jgi:quinol monooxygenase YgiN
VTRFGMFVKVTTHPGQRDTLVRYLLTAAELVNQAPGCETYLVHTSPTEPEVVWVSETWRNREDHDASLTIPGVRELIAKARPLIASMGEPVFTVPVGGKGFPAA